MRTVSIGIVLIKGCAIILLVISSVCADNCTSPSCSNSTNPSTTCSPSSSTNPCVTKGQGQPFANESSTTPSSGTTSSQKSFCDIGMNQSPIDVDVSNCKSKEYTPVVFKDNLLFSNEIEFENNCKTAEIHLTKKSIEPKVEGGPLGNNTYVIHNVHFHWGHKKTEGCEHTVSGRHYPMETHVVLRKSNFKTLQEALDGGGVAVLGFLYSNSQIENTILNPLLEPIKKIMAPKSTTNGTGEVLSYLKDYVTGGFYTYNGSLTTGLCSEGVLWILFKKSIPIGVAQLDYFHEIEGADGQELSNWRKVKPLNNREVCQSYF